MIEVQNLTKIYGKKSNIFTALDGVSFNIPTGATVAIIGKSGSGKSTLMHVMSGLDSPTRGSVTVNGRHLHALSKKEIDRFRAKEMSFIFQSFFVEGNQTVYQNVALPLEIAKVARRKRKKLVKSALDKVELGDKIRNKAKDLSGGQKQRLAIARAIVNNPKIIFADEPTGNLDSVTGETVIKLLFGLNRTMGSTLVIVTHDPELARRCQMQVIIKDGKIERLYGDKAVTVSAARAAQPAAPRPTRAVSSQKPPASKPVATTATAAPKRFGKVPAIASRLPRRATSHNELPKLQPVAAKPVQPATRPMPTGRPAFRSDKPKKGQRYVS